MISLAEQAAPREARVRAVPQLEAHAAPAGRVGRQLEDSDGRRALSTDINFEETLSTRDADRAKQIKTRAEVVENPTEKLMRELKENDRLRRAMAAGRSSWSTSAPAPPLQRELEAAKADAADAAAKAAKRVAALEADLNEARTRGGKAAADAGAGKSKLCTVL